MSSSIDPGQSGPTDAGDSPSVDVSPVAASVRPSTEAAPAPAPSEPESEPELTFPRLESFADMGLSEGLLQAVADMGWAAPTVVQAAAFDIIRQGRDVLVQSQTGTGKTGAFCLPWLASRFTPGDPAQTGVQLLVLVPTRELAKQVCDELVRLARHSPVEVLPIYGGTAMQPQLNALRSGVHAAVGTPGRILDHIRRRSLDLSKVQMVVLDEADEMLSMGFLEDIHAILEACPAETRQTTLFSATVPREVERIARRYMRAPVPLRLSGDDIAAAEIHHAFYSVSSAVKTRDLIDFIAVEEPTSGLVFCNTREEVNLVASVLQREGFSAEPLSSDLNQAARERVLGWMREGRLRFLVATDVASRGIDISHISHVINYSFPDNAETYVHRTGRTGRAGRAGQAISLISPHELGNFYYLKLQYPTISFTERQLPPADDLQAQRLELKLDQISKRFADLVSPEWALLARNLMKDPRGERVIALLLSRAMAQPTRPLSALEREMGEEGSRRIPRTHGDDRRGERAGDHGRGRGRERSRGGDRSRERPTAEVAGEAAQPWGNGASRGESTQGEAWAAPQGDWVPTRATSAEAVAPDAEQVQARDERGTRRRGQRRRGRQDGRGEVRESTGAMELAEAAPGQTPRGSRRGRGEPREDAAARVAGGEEIPAPLPVEPMAPGELHGTDGPTVPADPDVVAAPTPAEAGGADVTVLHDGVGLAPRRRRRRHRSSRRGATEGPASNAADELTTAEEADDEDSADASVRAQPEEDSASGAEGGRRRRRRRRGRRPEGDAIATVQSSVALVAPERPVPQDEILVDIDESELQLVRDQFGEIDELDDFTLKGRRRGVLDGLAEEVDLEVLQVGDERPAVTDDSESASDIDDESAGDDEDAETADADAESEADADAPKRKRRRRRRKKKAEPEPPPALMAPPHKDFWEVWAAHFSYQDFEDTDPPEPDPVDALPALAEAPQNHVEGDWLRVCLNIGRIHGQKASDIRDLLAERTGLTGKSVRNLTVGERDTEFQVGAGAWPRIQQGLQGPWQETVLEVALAPDAHAEAPPETTSSVPGASGESSNDAVPDQASGTLVNEAGDPAPVP